MKNSLKELLDLKQRLLTGNPEEISEIYLNNTVKMLDTAKQNAFRYVRLKMKNGSKSLDDFVYGSGKARAEEGLKLWRQLGALQDDLGLRSPAQKLLDESREALLLNRSNSEWLKKNGALTLGKLIYADALLQTGMSPKEQASYLRPTNLDVKATAIALELPKLKQLAAKDGPLTRAILQDDAFRSFADKWAVPMKEAYEKKTAPARLEEAKRDFSKGYALDVASRELGIGSKSELKTAKNKFLVRKAEEVIKRPDFQEVMARMTEGKTLEEIRKLHPPAAPSKGDDFSPVRTRYLHTVQTLAYEKRCAALTAEAILRYRGQQPAQKEIDRISGDLRKDARFRDFIQSKVKDLDHNAVEALVNDLGKPSVQQDTIAGIRQAVALAPVQAPVGQQDQAPAVGKPPVQAAGAGDPAFKNQPEQMVQNKMG